MTGLRRRAALARLGAAILAPSFAAAGGAALAQDTAPERGALAKLKRELALYVDSSRYDGQIAAVAAEAQAWVERRAPEVAKPAVVFDIDETALSNLRWLRANDWGLIVDGTCSLEPRQPCGFYAWAERVESATPVRPILALAKRAAEIGAATFFITGRRERARAATERALAAAGYAPTGVVLQPEDLRVRGAAEFKAPERARIAASGHTVVANIGDQQSDLDGGHAERTFLLPNPFYFLP